MRSDMHKVIVERPRLRTPRREGSLYPRGALRDRYGDLESAPTREAMGRGYGTKHLNENLAPLVRYLRSQVGRPWDKVFSEMSAHLSPRTAIQKHVFEHLGDYLNRRVRLVNGVLWGADRYGRPIELVPSYREQFFVCPETGLLRQVPIQPGRGRRFAPRRNPDIRVLGPMAELHRIDGQWYRIDFELLPDDPLEARRCFDVLLGAYVTHAVRYTSLWARHRRTDRYAAHKRQLARRELAQLLRD